MPCLLVAVALFAPRLVLFFIWALTNCISYAYQSVVWPVLGFLFAPYTTLAYMAAMCNNDHQLTGGWIVLLIFAILADIGSVEGSATS